MPQHIQAATTAREHDFVPDPLRVRRVHATDHSDPLRRRRISQGLRLEDHHALRRFRDHRLCTVPAQLVPLPGSRSAGQRDQGGDSKGADRPSRLVVAHPTRFLSRHECHGGKGGPLCGAQAKVLADLQAQLLLLDPGPMRQLLPGATASPSGHRRHLLLCLGQHPVHHEAHAHRAPKTRPLKVGAKPPRNRRPRRQPREMSPKRPQPLTKTCRVLGPTTVLQRSSRKTGLERGIAPAFRPRLLQISALRSENRPRSIPTH